MDRESLIKAFKLNDPLYKSQLGQFLNDGAQHILGLRVDTQRSVKKIFRIENLEQFISNLENDSDLIVIKAAGHLQPEVIRWVTDNEAVEYIRKQFENFNQALDDSDSIGRQPSANILELYDQMQRFIDRPAVLQKLTEERIKLMEIVLEWSDNLLDIESDHEFAVQDQQSEQLDKIASKIILLKKREKRLSEMLISSSELFSDLSQHSNYRSNLQETIEILQKEAQQLFSLWLRDSNSTVEISVLNRSCIEFRDEMPHVTLTETMISMIQGAEKLIEYGLIVNTQSSVAKLQNSITPLLAQVKVLQSVVDFYNRIGSEIRPCHASLLLKHANNFTELLESVQTKSVRWNDGADKIRAWIGMLQSSMQSLVQQNDKILKQHNEMISILVRAFDEIDISTSLKHWIDTRFPVSLSRIKTCNEEIKLHFPNPKETFSWRKHIDYQIYKVIRYALLNGSSRTLQNSFKDKTTSLANSDLLSGTSSTSFVVSLQLDSQGNVSYDPPAEQIKYRYLKMLNSMISLPSSVTGLVDWTREANLPNNHTIFYAIYFSEDSGQLLGQFYSRYNQLSAELAQIKHPFRIWSCLYLLIQTIKTEIYEGRYENIGQLKTLKLHSLEEFRALLEQIRAMSQQFSARFEIVNELQSQIWPELIVNIVPIKMLIKWLIGETRVVILQILSQQITVQAKAIEKQCSDNLKRFHEIPNTLEALVESETYLSSQLPGVYSEMRIEIVSLREKIKFAESYQQSIAIQQTVNALFNEFENFYNHSDDLRKDIQESIQAVFGNEKRRIEAVVEDFLERWANLGDLLKTAPEIVSSFVANSQEIHSQIEPLKRAKEHLDPNSKTVLFPNLNKFTVVCEEIQQLNGKYGVLREFESTLSTFLKAEWIVSRNKIAAIESQLDEWWKKYSNSPGSEVIHGYLESWRQFLVAVQVCKGEQYSAQHWSILLSILEIEDCPFEQIKTEDFYRKRERLKDAQDSIKELNKMAVRDRYVEDTFRELERIDQVSRFSLGSYNTKDGKTIQIVKNWQEATDIWSDASLLLSSLQEMSPDTNQQTQAKIQEWEGRLALLQLLLGTFNRVQRKWISLEPIFSVQQSLNVSGVRSDSFTVEREMFSKNSTDFRRLLNQVIIENRARIFAITYSDLKFETRLDTLEKQFSLIQKRLRNMMESARQRFARFYFISDEDLLLILSGKVDLNESGLVQKLFSNSISKFVYADNSAKVIAVHSMQGEILQLRSAVEIPKESSSAAIETGLSKLSSEIEATLLNDFQTNYNEMSQVFRADIWCRICSQLLSLYSWLDFTSKVEHAIPKNSLVSIESEYEKHLKEFTSPESRLQLENTFRQYNPQESNLFEIKLRQTVLDLIHFLQVIDRLKQASVTSVEDWQWQQELRFYSSSPSSAVLAKMGVAMIEYSFAYYLGAFGESKLVHTELTNRCFLTMTQAAALGLGANPYGPAGTGKTETVKALGVHLGREVLVFNCDEAIDTRSMIRILLGIVQCGAWACFDEFNRLQLDVLSVLSTLIGTLQDALKSGKTKITLPAGLSEVSTININHRSAIFITLNPAGKQYSARNELPDNLKALFLPISMTTPDLKDIISFLFVAQGFPRSVAGVLAIKMCLLFDFASGSLSSQRHYDWGLRAMKSCVLAVGQKFTTKEMNREQQFGLVVETLKQQICPKLVGADVDKFRILLKSVFGRFIDEQGVTNNDNDEALNHDRLREAFKELSLEYDEKMVQKVTELYYQLKSRFGVVLVGPTGSGKTTAWRLLKRTLEISDKIAAITISPKCIVPRTRLFGVVDYETRDWLDGLFTLNARTVATNGERTWFIFDGEIDPEWVEALNSVLDDNRVLTLASGERINFDVNRCNIIFECTSLRHASPATISRLGVICFPINLSILEYIFTNHAEDANSIKDLVHSQSDAITQDSVYRFFSIVRTLKVCQEEFNLQVLFGELIAPDEHHADYGIDARFNEFTPIGNNIIQSSNMSTLCKRMEAVLSAEKNRIKLILYGPKSCGKRTFLEATIFSKTASTVIIYNCTANCDSKQLAQTILNAGTLKRTRNGQQALSFANDSCWLVLRTWELLSRDKWGGNSIEAFVLFIVSYGGFYHFESYEWIKIENLNIAITCDESLDIDTRLQAYFHLFRMSPLTLNDIANIITIKALGSERQDLAESLPTRLMQYLKMLVEVDEPLNFLNMSLLVLSNLLLIPNVDDDTINYEIVRTFCASLFSQQHIDELRSTLGNNNSIGIYLPEGNGKFEYLTLKAEQVTEHLLTSIQKPEESENFAITNSVIELVQTLTFFFHSRPNASSAEKFNVETMILVGNRGFQRKNMSHIIAEQFGYQLWTARGLQNERQLVNDLKQVFSADGSDRKLLLFVDQIYLECLDFLKHYIIEICRPNEILAGSKSSMHCSFITELPSINLRIIISKDQIDHEDNFFWLRNNASYCILSRPSNSDYRIVGESILPSDQKHFYERLFEVFIYFSKNLNSLVPRKSYRKDVHTNMITFATFIRMFVSLYNEHCSKMQNERQRLESGVLALDRVSEAVSALKSETLENRELLDVKQKDADEAFEMIVVSMQSSEDKREELEKLQVKIASETEELKKQKQKVDDELEQIEPLLEKAKESVGSIKNEALSEVRSLRAPPVVIRDILEGVLRLLGVKDTSWNSMKNYLSRKGISQIVNFDPSQVSSSALEPVEQLLASRGSSFEPANAKRASVAAASLAEWVTANVRYVKVIGKVKPYQMELQRLEGKLNSAHVRLKTLGFEMNGVDTQVQALRDRMQKHTVEAAQIEMNLNKSNKILETSEILVSRLSSEHARWRQKLSKIELDFGNLSIKLALAIAYCFFGPILQHQRERKRMWNEALQKFIPEIRSFNLFDIFEQDEIATFLQLQNADTVVFVHDPHNKVLDSLQVTNTTQFKETSFEQKDCFRQIELAQRLGKVLLIKNADPSQFHNSKTLETLFGFRSSDKNSTYRLFVLINDINSFESYPSILSVARQINLGGSFETIIETLVTKILKIAAPQLQNDIDETRRNIVSDRKRLEKLEEELLQCLADQTKDGSSIVQDESLMEKLTKLKESSASIENAIGHSVKILEENLQTNAAKFRGTAELAGRLFQMIECLTTFSSMYYVGFNEFEDLFERILRQKMVSNEKIEDLVLVQAIYDHVSKSLFPPHQRALIKLINREFQEIHPSNNSAKYDINSFLKELFQQSSQDSQSTVKTVLIITSKGENVIPDINRFLGSSMIYISLGFSSIQNAEAMFRSSSLSQTKPVCFANLHLVSGWLNNLVQLLKIPRKFDVILISEMCEHLPKMLLEQCIKYVHYSSNEHSTSGLKVPTLKTNSDVSDRLELVHWIVTERRLYVPIGWSKQYEFGNTEKLFSQHLLELIHRRLVSTNRSDVHMRSWLIGLLGNVIYGAKLDRTQDRLVLEKILQRVFNEHSGSSGNYLNELELPENVGRIRARFIQEELSKNFNILFRAFNDKVESSFIIEQKNNGETNIKEQKSVLNGVPKFNHKYFQVLWRKILQKCKIYVSEDGKTLEFSEMAPKNVENHTFGMILKQEISSCKNLITKIHQCLFLEKELPPTEKRALVKSLKINETPYTWTEIWPNSSIIAQEFLIDLAKIYRKLCQNEQEVGELDLRACYDPCLVFRQIQQLAADQLKICLDELAFNCVWNLPGKPNEISRTNLNISGISIEGASYDQNLNELVFVEADSPVLKIMPVLFLKFDRIDSIEKVKPTHTKIELPMYTNSSREILITNRIAVNCSPSVKGRFLERNVAFVLERLQ